MAEGIVLGSLDSLGGPWPGRFEGVPTIGDRLLLTHHDVPPRQWPSDYSCLYSSYEPVPGSEMRAAQTEGRPPPGNGSPAQRRPAVKSTTESSTVRAEGKSWNCWKFLARVTHWRRGKEVGIDGFPVLLRSCAGLDRA